MRAFTALPRSLVLLLLIAASAVAVPPPWEPAEQAVLTHPGSGHRGAVASESRVCSQIGIDLLVLGGNAVDAWVGTQLCVGVIGMYHSGIGGGGFALIRDGRGNYTVIDYRETAPESAFTDMYRDNVAGSVFGGLAAGVPGELRGLETTHRRFGVLPWKTVVQPAADVARDGFSVTEDLVRCMEHGIGSAGFNFLVEDPSWAEDFAPDGKLVKLGDIMTRKRYGETLQKIAEHGADVFYTGPMAEAMIKYVQEHNGTMALSDLATYNAIEREPISITYGDYTLHSSGAPSSGAVCLSTLKTMEGYAQDSSSDANLTLHRLDEAMRFAYGAHQALGDPAFVPADVSALEAEMLNSSHAAAVRARILDNSTQPVSHYDPARVYGPAGHGTSHVVAADGAGMAVSSTTTINLLFGCLLMVPATGVVLNNEMNDFSIPGVRNEFGYAPSVANYIRPRKRPLSSITPVIVEKKSKKSSQDGDGASDSWELFASVGAAGGSRIISSTTQVVWHMVEQGASMREAIAAPRFHDQLMPNQAVFEWTFDNATVASMAEKGHNVTWVRPGISAVQGIRVDGESGAFEAVGETRQKNSAGLTL
ncbi:gamma-glutamyltranspeptidase [Whalleya microplaca]|nr:gamma-glutamyltranspeptidase [Whalleya microplaca]